MMKVNKKALILISTLLIILCCCIIIILGGIFFLFTSGRVVDEAELEGVVDKYIFVSCMTSYGDVEVINSTDVKLPPYKIHHSNNYFVNRQVQINDKVFTVNYKIDLTAGPSPRDPLPIEVIDIKTENGEKAICSDFRAK